MGLHRETDCVKFEHFIGTLFSIPITATPSPGTVLNQQCLAAGRIYNQWAPPQYDPAAL